MYGEYKMEIRKKITWRRLNPDKKQSRLDIFLLSAKTQSGMYTKMVLFQDIEQTISVSISKLNFKTMSVEKAIGNLTTRF